MTKSDKTYRKRLASLKKARAARSEKLAARKNGDTFVLTVNLKWDTIPTAALLAELNRRFSDV